MSIFELVDWAAVRRHYDLRVKVHSRLVDLHNGRSVHDFSLTALNGPDSNYSAVEHGLGPKILGMNGNAEAQVYGLAGKFIDLANARMVPELIRAAHVKFLQIGVGSELSCMVNPKVCWVANTRTIWTHLVIKHADSFARADEELKLYREADVNSEMAYHMWSAIHAELSVALVRVSEISIRHSAKAGIAPGPITYLWADAIASHLYETHHS